MELFLLLSLLCMLFVLKLCMLAGHVCGAYKKTCINAKIVVWEHITFPLGETCQIKPFAIRHMHIYANKHTFIFEFGARRPARVFSQVDRYLTVAIHLRHVTHQIIHTPAHDLFSLLNANPRHPPTSNTQNLKNKYIFISRFCIPRTCVLNAPSAWRSEGEKA